jgi:hypothetical protein
MREIPEELCGTAKNMRESGSTTKDVENWLKLEVVKRTGLEPVFTYDDVRRLVGPTTSQRAWDATDFIEALARRQREEALPYFVKLDSDGRLENAFWVTRGGMEVFAVGYAVLQPLPRSPTLAPCPAPHSRALSAAGRGMSSFSTPSTAPTHTSSSWAASAPLARAAAQ